LQRASKLAAGRVHKSLWKQADPRFVWNKNLLEELIEAKLDEFIIPLIQGNIQKIQKISLLYFFVSLLLGGVYTCFACITLIYVPCYPN